jgi:acylphosphatase
MAIVAAEAIIVGRVQGVFFRASTREEAVRLGVSGWVRNLPDGSVQLYAEGEESPVRQLLAWCAEGPPAARVDDVDVTWVPPRGEKGFGLSR